jgi:hypothetical protein
MSFTGGTMVIHLTLLLLLTETVVIGYGQEASPGKSGLKDALHTATLPPCQACKVFVDSFKKVRFIVYGILVLMSDVRFWLSGFSHIVC